MAEATNAQMQQYANERVRRRAEAFRNLLVACADDKASIDDVYARAVGNSRWDDVRGDGPPHLLQSGNSANPDDMLNYNAFISHLLWLVNGTGSGDVPTSGGTAAEFAAAFRAQWAVLVDACVRPIND